MLKIAIIDSGLRTDHPNFKNDVLTGFTITPTGKADAFTDEFGHGTAVYNIIRSVNEYADIINIKLPGIEKGLEEEELITALEYIADTMQVDIINLSMGISVCEQQKRMSDCCKRLENKGCLIFCAFDNSGSMSYPALFESVIGVTSGFDCKKTTDFEYYEDTCINIGAKGSVQRLAWLSPDYILLGGNSFACAHAAAQAATFMRDGVVGRKNILRAFKNISVSSYCINQQAKPAVEKVHINKAVLFPFNKEMHSLIRYEQELDFNIAAVYHVKYSAVVGATTCRLMNDDSVSNHVIQNIDQMDWENWDTLILGHLDVLQQMKFGEELKRSLIQTALKKGKQIYSFDDVGNFVSDEYKKQYFYPQVTKEYLPANRMGKLFRISKPVLGIFGTSSRQGKFTLQMKLRSLLQLKGYTIGQIGSEPSACLYGMDYTFPMGYHSSVKIESYDTVLYLNYLMNELCKKEYDLLCVGSQSGTVQYDIGNMEFLNIPQYHFLLGTQPDAVLLCVNPYDELDYINRTILFLESVVQGCRVLGLVVFPMDISNDWQGIYGKKSKLTESGYLKVKEKLTEHFKRPVFQLGDDKDMEDACSLVIDYFSYE